LTQTLLHINYSDGAKQDQQAPSIKKRTKQSEPTCRPWQGGSRESGDAVTNSGNEEGQNAERNPANQVVYTRSPQ
jgi:hypothetical protein